MRDKSGEQLRERANESMARSSPPPCFPFCREVGGEIFIISFNGACIYKRASRGYKWALIIISQVSWLCNWVMNTLVGVPNI